MWQCGKCQETIGDSFDACWNCGTSREGKETPDFKRQKQQVEDTNEIPRGMILVTTPSLESHHVKKYLGVVCGEAIVGVTVFGNIFRDVADVIGGRHSAHESTLAEARRIAMAQMAQHAKDVGGNAVLSLAIGYETIRESMLMVTCTGTAAEIEGPQMATEVADRSAR
jgi:uncharacterized protein YbjQ (UPF0145 family)